MIESNRIMIFINEDNIYEIFIKCDVRTCININRLDRYFHRRTKVELNDKIDKIPWRLSIEYNVKRLPKVNKIRLIIGHSNDSNNSQMELHKTLRGKNSRISVYYGTCKTLKYYLVGNFYLTLYIKDDIVKPSSLNEVDGYYLCKEIKPKICDINNSDENAIADSDKIFMNATFDNLPYGANMNILYNGYK